jgi:hypothetical protein
MKLDLLTNATVVDDAIRFVSSKSKESSNSNEGDKKPDYDEDQIEEQHEQKTMKISTTNHIF